ncbi:MAG: right-handed parallel beta-helix repeat-containing protein [Prevotella sp.]|nr:right-handed parallel beta-helix repeat-containing protein [Prevotella sp.]
MNKFALTLLCLVAVVLTANSKAIYVAPDGDDNAEGTLSAPLATLPAAYKLVTTGDTVWFRGGTYKITDEQVMGYKEPYACVFMLEKAGTSKGRTCYMGYPGERPVFDFSALQLDGKHRFAAFYLGANYLHLRNFDIVGVPVRVTGHTQSECVAARKGSYCIVENIAMHDGMAIGYYQTAGSNNLVLNCDAYNNYDAYSEGTYGGNVDGFGCHVGNAGLTGNVFRGCRAWRNSDDGFDLINCFAPVEFDHCFAFYNGFQPTTDPKDTKTFANAGDGNGFKAGGYGMSETLKKEPNPCPEHYVHHCVAYLNKSNGIYSNHHLGGNRWEYNSSGQNRRYNYSMVNRKSAAEAVDVDGYDHTLTGNVSWHDNGKHLTQCNQTSCTLTANTFGPAPITVSSSDFVSVDAANLFAQRDAEGNLPNINFMVAKKGSAIAEAAIGWSFQSSETAVLMPQTETPNQERYELSGRAVAHEQSGRLYITNGKKMVVR